MKRSLLGILAFGLALALSPTLYADEAADQEYKTFLRIFDDPLQIVRGDLVRLRALFAKSSYYRGNESDPYADILNALARGSDSDAPPLDHVALRKKINDNFPMWLGHAVALGVLGKDLSRDERVREMVAFAKLRDAILKNGTGESADTAYVALSVPESQQIVRELGFDIEVQMLQTAGNRSFDVYQVVDPKTKAKRTIWVDVSALFQN